MTYDRAIRSYFKGVSDFWLEVGNRWQRAREAFDRPPPDHYTFDRLTNDTLAIWAKGMDTWLGWYAAVPESLLPTVVITAPAAAMSGHGADAAVTAAVPPGVTPTVTDLARLGGTQVIRASDLKPALSGGMLTLTFVHPIASVGLAPGLYQGLVYALIGRKTVPLAVVLAQLT